MTITTNAGLLLLALGLVVYGIGMFVPIAISNEIIGLWAIITALALVLVRR